MAIFLTENERRAVARDGFYRALLGRAARRAQSPGLIGRETTADWWHVAYEYVTDAAMAHALEPSEAVAAWLRGVVLDIVRRPEEDWVGPAFRDRASRPLVGHLETAHLCQAAAMALDLAPDVFRDGERDEIAATLRERGMPMCLRWLERTRHLHNWRCVLAAGIAVPAAVLDDRPLMERAAEEFHLCSQGFQGDGSYGEGVQYANYAASSLMLIWESLVRRDPAFASRISPRAYAPAVRWWAASLLYTKPLSGWGAYPRPRSANFCDAAALFSPGADLLLHIAARMKEEMPVEAGLARRLFETVYRDQPAQGPHDRSSFGFVNRPGLLTLPLLASAAAPLSPEEAGIPETAAFDCGDVLARDSWDGRTVLAVHGGGEPLHVAAHLHEDLNSFILVHNRERLLLAPGHSCYRGLVHEIEMSTRSHNTCTFTMEDGRTLRQSGVGHRQIAGGQPGPPLNRGARRLLAAREGAITVIGSDAAETYGTEIEAFARFWILCGAHALFIVDRIVSRAPVRASWHWLLNNRDGELDLKLYPPDRLVARRGDAGMKLFHAAGGSLEGPAYAFVHDAYHPLPGQLGEGRSGSGLLIGWREKAARTTRVAVHAIALDDYGGIAGWHWRDGNTLEGPGGKERWTLTVTDDGAAMVVNDTYRVAPDDGGRWGLGLR